MELLAQVFGFSAIGMSIIIYSRKNREKLLLSKLFQDIFWAIHYFLLGAYSAMATNLIGASREIVFGSKNPKLGKNLFITLSYIVFYFASALITWKNAFSIFPAMSSVFSTIALSAKKPVHTKLLAIPSALCTLVYNVTTSHSLSVYIGLSVTLSTIIFSLISTYVSYAKEIRQK